MIDQPRQLVFVPGRGTGDVGVCHYYDDDPTVSLCGLDISECVDVDEGYEPVCVVCEDLDRILPARPDPEAEACVLRDLIAGGLVGIRPQDLPVSGGSFEQVWGCWRERPLEIRWFCPQCCADWTVPRAHTLDEGAICPRCQDPDRWPYLVRLREVA